mmetsp:Transcript_145919/g.271700  ORF Transcript_145919/g.271700 Transcript_145919/m.271700 type:complete len:391 (+) Transcript_145919:124-1296(+)
MGDALTTMCVAEEEEEEDDTLFDKYKVGERIGVGAFGEVRVCSVSPYYDLSPEEAAELPEVLAVKIVDQENAMLKAAEAYTTVRDEVDILQTMSHEYVVRLVETFEDHRFLYVVMERVPGGELFKAIRSRNVLVTESDMAKVASQLMQALAYLQSVGVVHRDVKAQNILLTKPPDRFGRLLQSTDIKLIDFGMAARFPKDCPNQVLGKNGENHFKLVCGTPVMAAPEIWSAQDNAPQEWVDMYGGSYGPKVDVWSAGVVLYLALMGQLPFCDRDVMRLASMICDPNSLPSFKRVKCMYKVSENCLAFLRSVLQKDPAERPSAQQAARAKWLQPQRRTRALDDTPVPAEVFAAADAQADAAVPHLNPQDPYANEREIAFKYIQMKAEAALV